MSTPRTFCQSYFELLGLPVSFEVNLSELNQRYKSLQKEMHPDRFVNNSEHEQRLSLQYAAFLNEAVATLKSPLKRSHYLLKLKGREVDVEHYTIRDTAYLMQQMQWRETLEELGGEKNPLVTIEQLQTQVDELLNENSAQFKQAYETGNLVMAEEAIHKMHFVYKLQHELEVAYEKYDS